MINYQPETTLGDQPNGSAYSRRAMLLGVAGLLAGSGCAWHKKNIVFHEDVPWSQLTEHLNQNIRHTTAWRCTSAKITPHGPLALTASLSANLAVEAPKNFRLMANSPVGNEVDIGSNDEHFWFWIRRDDPPGLYMCEHSQVQAAQHRMPLPFEPDWLIDTLGVIPLDEQELEWEDHQTNPKMAFFRRRRLSPQGEPVELVTLVDKRQGLMLEHSLVDQNRKMIARAVMQEHETDAKTGVVLPHTIELSWPRQGMGMSLRMGAIVVNPANLTADNFSMPAPKNCPVYDLGSGLEAEPVQPAGHVRLSEIEEESPE